MRFDLINICDDFYYDEKDKMILIKRKNKLGSSNWVYNSYISINYLLLSKGNDFMYSTRKDTEKEKKIFKAILEKYPEILI